MKTLRRLLGLLKGRWNLVSLYLSFNILNTIFSLFSIAMVIPFLRILFEMEEKVNTTVPFKFSLESIQHNLNYLISTLIDSYGKAQTLLFTCFVIVGLFLFRNIFTYLSNYFVAPVRHGIVQDLRNKMYRRILDLPISYFSNERKGDIMSRMSADAQEVDISIMASIQVLFRDPIVIIVYIGSLFLMNFKLTFILLGMLPVIGYLLGRIGRALKKKSRRGQERLGILTSIVEETLHGLRIIKGFNSENFSYNKAADTNNFYTRLMIKIFRRRTLASPLTEFISIIVLVIILYIGAGIVLGKDSAFTAEAFIAYILIFSQIIPPAKSFSSAYYNMQKGMASLDRVEELINAEVKIKDPEHPIKPKQFNKTITYKNVSFKYVDEFVLKQINLEVPKGRTIAIVGPSGAGKSTLVDLLPRFFDVTDGEILIDGVDIRKMKMYDLRQFFGIVNQDPILFNDTFFNNIAFGAPETSMEDVEKAARIANAHDFIMEAPEGYQAGIGDQGSKLSGGQRQRLSIARAVLKNPPILILDEATSSLDSENEKIVQDALDRLMQDRTSIVIAHRLSTIVKADSIVVLNEGKIVEQGKHEELLKQNGHYKKLYDLQMFA
ncbi:MAG: antibiotic ABC transporter ATP-binding protein [Marinilabiliales bacterium]|nr:MAG: antibiotic ABC transporter ATP-binding protein [Marinilabiliales bacterium]